MSAANLIYLRSYYSTFYRNLLFFPQSSLTISNPLAVTNVYAINYYPKVHIRSHRPAPLSLVFCSGTSASCGPLPPGCI